MTRATPPASGTISGCTSTASSSASSPSPHSAARRTGSTANADAQQLLTAAATSSGPTPVTEENAPAHRPSPSSGLDDRTITRPPRLSTAARSSSTSPGSSDRPSAATRPAPTPFARMASTPAPIALFPKPTGTTHPGNTGNPARSAAPSRAALKPTVAVDGAGKGPAPVSAGGFAGRASGGVANGVLPVATPSLPGHPTDRADVAAAPFPSGISRATEPLTPRR
jgi:hypothetical protein